MKFKITTKGIVIAVIAAVVVLGIVFAIPFMIKG
jgi:hypothetical protein